MSENLFGLTVATDKGLDDLQCQRLLSENRSLHLTIRLPVFFAEKEVHVPVEIQLRTIAMDFWASLEHTIRYKKNLPINAEIETELKECADSSREWDSKMEHLLHILTSYVGYKRTSIHFRCLLFYVVSEIIPKCFRASVIALSFSGGHCGCRASPDFGLLSFSRSIMPCCCFT